MKNIRSFLCQLVSALFSVCFALNVTGAESNLSYFVFNSISSPKYMNDPFPVTITAKDISNLTVATYTKPAILNGWEGAHAYGHTTNLLLNTASNNSWSGGNRVRGIRFTPANDLTVTHVRRFFGDKVAIWTDEGSLLAEKEVSGASGAWMEAPLDSPIQTHHYALHPRIDHQYHTCMFCHNTYQLYPIVSFASHQ